MSALKFLPNTLIEVVGNVASGKTTLAKKLPQVTNLTYTDIDLFENNPFLLPSEENPKRWVFTEELYFYYLRAKKIPQIIKDLQKNPLVLDQGFHLPFYMYVNNRLRQKTITKEEWRFLNEMFLFLTKDAPIPSIVIFLDIPIEELLNRMYKRGRKEKRVHEMTYTKKYLLGLQLGLEDYVEKMKKEKKCKSVIIFDYKSKSFKTFGEEQKKLIDVLKPLLS